MKELTLTLNKERFLKILGELISLAEIVQNGEGFKPQESKIVEVILKYLEPYKNIIEIETPTFVEGRSNLILKYKGKTDKTISFVGSHLDVVPVDKPKWNKEPFKLTIDGDKLWGRGTTDCLGHVAAITDLFISLAEEKPELNTSVVAILPANEESSPVIMVGLDALNKAGHFKSLDNGPMYWVDSSDFGPTTATKGASTWKLKVIGKKAHSGSFIFGINAQDIAMRTYQKMQKHFYEKFPITEKDKQYKDLTKPSLSGTKIKNQNIGITAIPDECTLEGDIRTTPSYDIQTIRAELQSFISEIQTKPKQLEEYEHENFENATITFELSELAENGYGANLKGEAYKLYINALTAIGQTPNPKAANGTLPQIFELSQHGFDIIPIGFGKDEAYHQDNEFALLSDFIAGMKIFRQIINLANA